MVFKKGGVPWNKYKAGTYKPKRSEEQKRKHLARMKHNTINKGRVQSKDHIQKRNAAIKDKGFKLGFSKGNMPWNKGTKGAMPPPRSCFKQGHKPWSYIDGRSKTQCWNRYGPDWERIRNAVYIRDDFTCQHCFKTGLRLAAHHKIPFLLTRDNSLENLITLCSGCHRKEEVRIMKELKKQEEV